MERVIMKKVYQVKNQKTIKWLSDMTGLDILTHSPVITLTVEKCELIPNEIRVIAEYLTIGKKVSYQKTRFSVYL